MDWIYEGHVSGGYDKFSGFGRFGINSPNPELAVGYWNGYEKITKGIVHTGNYIYEGTWTSEEDYNKLPDDKHRVTDLSTK
jgi:hypothetical protein